MNKPKQPILPIPVDAELYRMIDEAAKETGLKRADIMRQGLRHGVPAFVSRLREFTQVLPPVDLSFLDRHPKSPVAAKDYKKALKEKLSPKYGRPNR